MSSAIIGAKADVFNPLACSSSCEGAAYSASERYLELFSGSAKKENMKPTIIPILRIFDIKKAKEFYCDFLGWKIDWSHTFGDNFPVYLQISKDACIIHLSEHFGDACPGSTLKINVENIDDMASLLREKDYKYSKPGAEIMPWKTKEMKIHDPFGNKLVFYQDMADEKET